MMKVQDEDLVSIIMPFKNTSQFLKECIQSILNQSYTNWELCAVNDNSSDDSYRIAEEFSKQDARIKVFNNTGVGIISALQCAFSQSNGNFITRMDSDDLMDSDKLHTMIAQLKDNGSGKIALGLVKYFSEKIIGDGYQKYENWLNSLVIKGTNFSELYKECVIASPCWMVYREDFIKCGGFDNDIYPEDYDLTFRFYAQGFTCIPTNKIAHYWRDYGERTSRTHDHYAYNSFLEIKIFYFLKLNYDTSRPLVLWGAGKKGKKLAELLLENDVKFHWVCDNPEKIGKTIYGQKMLGLRDLKNSENVQSIIAVANPKAQETIKMYFSDRKKKPMVDYFFFC